MNALPFVPGYPTEPYFPLARYLTTVPDSVAGTYVEKYTHPGDLILDPFGASPRIAVEAAQAGRRVIVVNRNPVMRFVTEVAADPPAATVARRALTKLADAPAAGGPVEESVRSMYRSQCPDCGHDVDPEYFAWQGDHIFEKRFYCAHCAEDRLRPAREADTAHAARFKDGGPGFHWALDRLTPAGDPDRRHVRRALAAYTPRALQAIFTLLTKARAIDLDPDERRALDALLLLALDEASSLWPYPSERGRPKTLNPHQSFRERNIWLALEQGVGLFAAGGVRLTTIGELLATRKPGVGVAAGPLRALAGEVEQSQIKLALTNVPRPNPVLWTLSTVWAAWLWDISPSPETRPLLRRRRYDWTWHTRALTGAFGALARLLADDTPLIALMPTAESAFLTAAVMAAAEHWQLEGLALQPDGPSAQIIWRPGTPARAPVAGNVETILREQATRGVLAALEARAEPTTAGTLHAAALTSLAEHDTLRRATQSLQDEAFATVLKTVNAAIAPEGATRQPGERDLIWPRELPVRNKPVSERAEAALARFLAVHARATTQQIFSAVCAALPGLSTPALEWIALCLDSYGEETEPDRWRCRPEDMPPARTRDRAALRATLQELGARLGFASDSPAPDTVTWSSRGQADFAFTLLSSAGITKFVLAGAHTPTQRVFVVPGSRSAMIQFRLHHDRRLAQALERGGWTFLKNRHVRRLAADPDLERTSLNSVLGLDPIVEQPSTQIPLL